jgi:hypothetical protein
LTSRGHGLVVLSDEQFVTGSRFSGRVLRSGDHLVPEAALEALADQNIEFTVKGKTTYEQQMAAVRRTASPSVQ